MKYIIGSSAVVFLLTLSNIDLTRAVDWNEPISSKDYQSIIGQGFSTNYFKIEEPLSDKFKESNIIEVYKAGFRNLRLRCRADFEGLLPYNTSKFLQFLEDLAKVVDVCLENNVKPIITWVHNPDEKNPTEEAKKNYIAWWGAVATRLKKKDYRLSFNLFTELGIDMKCKDCGKTLRENPDLYNEWTQAVVDKIRSTGGKNKKRILILASPLKTAIGLEKIKNTIYEKEKPYVMAEWHNYASGPNQVYLKEDKKSNKYWEGKGTDSDRARVNKDIEIATSFTKSSGVPTYQGAWMPFDNLGGQLNQTEVKYFARYYIRALGKAKIPWSSNVLDKYMDTPTSKWREELQVIPKEGGAELYMNVILKSIKKAMTPYIPVN